MRWYVEFQVAGHAAQYCELTGLERVDCGSHKEAHLRLPKLPKLPDLLVHFELKVDGVVLQRTGTNGPDIELANRTYREVCVPWEQDAFVGPVRFCFLLGEGRTFGQR